MRREAVVVAVPSRLPVLTTKAASLLLTLLRGAAPNRAAEHVSASGRVRST